MVFLLPTLSALRKSFPHSRLTLLRGFYFAAKDLIFLGHSIDEIQIVDWLKTDEKERQTINSTLGAQDFDICFSTCLNPVRYFLSVLSKTPHRVGEVRAASTYSRGFLSKFSHLIWHEELYRKRVFNYPLVIDDVM